MEKIVVANDSTLENMPVSFRHILPESAKIAASPAFMPLESLTGHIPEKFFPSALTSLSVADALAELKGGDELELFFMILLGDLSDGDVSGHVSTNELLDKIKAAKEFISKDNYLNLLVFLLAKSGNADSGILNEIKENLTESDPVTELLLSFYDESPREIADTKAKESLCAAFFEAIKAEKSGDYSKAFSLMQLVFEESDLHPFIFEILKFYIMQYSGIPDEKIARFTKTVTESPLPVSFTTVKFVEFCYYYKNNIEDKLEETAETLAENTDSVFILNIIAPVLYKYKKWDLVGKFYKLSSKKTFGAEKTMYLELLADLYENKLELPDFAAEIYRSTAEEDPVNCTVSLSKAAEIYEDTESWDKLSELFIMMAERENDPLIQAVYFSKAGGIFLRRLNNPEKAAEFFEKSLSAHYSFETARMLAGICAGTKNYGRYTELLISELENTPEDNGKIRILRKLAGCSTGSTENSEEAEKYLLEILRISPKDIESVQKLGKIYYNTKNWEKLTEINFKEIDLSRDISEIAGLYYKNGVIFYENIKDLTRATECFRELLEIIPEHLPSLLYLEKIYSKTKDRAGISFVLGEIADIIQTPSSKAGLSYLTKLAMISRDTGKTAQAGKIFAGILKNNPENIIAKENLRMASGKADFTNIETESIDYNEYNFELFIEYIKQSNSSFMTDEILKREAPSFWKELYFLYKEGVYEKLEASAGDKEDFILSLLRKEFSIDVLVKNPTKKVALMFLAGEYIKADFFDGVSIILDYYLKFEPKNKRKIWSLFFKGCQNPSLEDDLEELLTTISDKDTYDIIREILERIYIENKDFNTAFFIRSLTFQKMEDTDEKCRFIDETISLMGENISPERLMYLYRERIRLTTYENSDSFLKTYENPLTEIGAETLLVPIYEQKWEKEKERTSGEKLLKIYMKKKDTGHAVPVAEELFNMNRSVESLENYIETLKELDRTDAAVKLIKHELASSSGEETENKLKTMLFDILTETENIEEASEFFGNSEEEKAKINEKIEEYIAEGKYENAEKTIRTFISDPFEQTVFFAKTARSRNDTEKENELLASIMFEAVSRKVPYPLSRLTELNKKNIRLSLFLEKSLEFIGGKSDSAHDSFPRIFAIEKEKIFDFAGFNEKDEFLGEFIKIISSIPKRTKITAKPLHSNRHRILTQLVEYIKLTCNFEELEGLWDEESTVPCKAVVSQVPYIIFGPESLNMDFEKLKFTALREAFLISSGLESASPEFAEKIASMLRFTGKEKIQFVKSVRQSFQNRTIELIKLLENTDVSEIQSFFRKLREAAFWHAFGLVPDMNGAGGIAIDRIEKFVSRYF